MKNWLLAQLYCQFSVLVKGLIFVYTDAQNIYPSM